MPWRERKSEKKKERNLHRKLESAERGRSAGDSNEMSFNARRGRRTRTCKSYSRDGAEGVRRHTSSVSTKPRKRADMRIPHPPTPTPAAGCSGDRMAPRGALMPLVIICDTQLSLSPSRSLRSRANSSRNIPGEQRGHELISQPSGAGKRCRHHPVVLKPDWSKEPPTCKWSF